MPRIRSVKPEYATDGKIRRLSDSAALFFILLWNHCDDSGYFELDTWELSLKTGRWKPQAILNMLSSLAGRGLVRLSREAGVGLVVSWSHQRIDKPRPSKWEGVEIKWDEVTPFGEPSKNVPRKERIGEDRSGEDRIPYGSSQEKAGELLPVPASRKPSPKAEDGLKAKRLIAAYCEAFKARYGVRPEIDGKDAGTASRLAKGGISFERLCELIAEFFRMNDPWFVTKRHSLAVFAENLNAVKIRLETGLAPTQTEIRQVDKAQATSNAFESAKAWARAKEANHG